MNRKFPVVFCAILLVVVIESQQSCPDGWSAYHGSCYLYIHDRFTWFDAKVVCNTLNAKLVEIESEAENTYVASTIAAENVQYAWIGLADFAIEGDFTWASSQETPEYTKWQHGEPNDYGGRQDCVVIENTAHEWIDQFCEDDHYNFVCERSRDSAEIIG